MTAREYIKNLNPENSYWEIKEGDLERLNEVQPTAENLYMVFECSRCSSKDETVYHVVPYTKLKLDEYGDYDAFCDNDEKDYMKWVDANAIPTELKEIFQNTQFEIYVEPDEEEEDDSWDDDYDAEDEEAYADGDDDILCEDDCEDADDDDAESER